MNISEVKQNSDRNYRTVEEGYTTSFSNRNFLFILGIFNIMPVKGLFFAVHAPNNNMVKRKMILFTFIILVSMSFS